MKDSKIKKRDVIIYTLIVMLISCMPFMAYISSNSKERQPFGVYNISGTHSTTYFSFSKFDSFNTKNPKGEYYVYKDREIFSHGSYVRTSPYGAKNIYRLNDEIQNKTYYVVMEGKKIYILGYNNEDYELELVDKSFSVPYTESE